MSKVKLQAREIIRAAKRLNIEMGQGCYLNCAVGIVVIVNGIDPYGIEVNTSSTAAKIAETIGVNKDALIALEMGYEGYTTNRWLRRGENVSPETAAKLVKSRYFKVGQKIAQMAGLSILDKG